MATLAQIFDRWNGRAQAAAPPVQPENDRSRYRLRAFPNQDVFLFVKPFDNSRAGRQVDPVAKRTCWRAIGTSVAIAIFLTGTLVPQVYNLLAGYKLQSLRTAQQRLEAERGALEFKENSILTNENLQKIADEHAFLDPSLPQRSVYLDDKQSGAVAQVTPVPAQIDSRP